MSEYDILRSNPGNNYVRKHLNRRRVPDEPADYDNPAAAVTQLAFQNKMELKEPDFSNQLYAWSG